MIYYALIISKSHTPQLFFETNHIYDETIKHLKHNKITSRFRDNRTTTTAAARTSRRRAATGTPLPKSAWPCQWQPGSLYACSPKDKRPRTVVVAVELLHRSEVPDTKFHQMTRNDNLTAQGNGSNLRRSSVDYVHTDELEKNRSPKDKLEEKALPSIWAPHLRGLKEN